MSLLAKEQGERDFTPAPEGTHIARCVQVIDLGYQHSEKYGSWSPKVLIGWELLGEGCTQQYTDKEGKEHEKPYLVWNRYTLSLSTKSHLRPALEAWRGKKFTSAELQGFHLKKLLDVPCLLSIVHNENNGTVYANVAAIMSVPKGTKVPEHVNDLVFFEISEWDQTTFDTFSENLQTTIKKSKEYQYRVQPNEAEVTQEHQTVADDDDNIPF